MQVVVLTGAGISAESGIETFRSQDGLWCNHNIEEVATFEGFQNNPPLVHRFYNQRRAQLLKPNIKPNKAHLALTELEKWVYSKGGDFLLITQNIDNLHQRAGSENIIQMHGSLLELTCVFCNHIWANQKDTSTQSTCPNCAKKGGVRVNVVWFGEEPKELNACFNFLQKATLFISVGTSNQVYPAASFAQVALQNNAQLIEVNLEKTTNSHLFHQVHLGKASEKLPQVVARIKGDKPTP